MLEPGGMQEPRAALLPLCSLQARPHRASRGPTELLLCSRKLLGFSPPAPWWHLAQAPSQQWLATAGPGGALPAGELGQEAGMPALAPGRTLAPAGARGWLRGAPCPAVGQGWGATAWGRAGPVPGNSSPSSWMSALALIKTKSIFFCWKKRDTLLASAFLRVSSHVSAART